MRLAELPPASFPSAYRLLAAAGLGGVRPPLLEWLRGLPGCRLFAAFQDGRLIGTSVGLRHAGATGWIGLVAVQPGWERQGIGTRLTEAAMGFLTAAGAATLLLIATDKGRPVYERLGFREMDAFLVLRLAPPTDRHPVVPLDWASALELDRRATGEARGEVLTRLGVPPFAVPGREGDGFVLPSPFGGGPLVAEDPDVALRLLPLLAGGRPAPLRLRVSEANAAGRRRLERLGAVVERRSPRMVLGPEPPVEAALVYNILNPAVG